jgi:O-methyltransferase
MSNPLRLIYNSLPESWKAVARYIWSRLPWRNQAKQRRWVTDTYHAFGRQERQRIFLSIARFLHINRPITGYYFEFGCNEANTVRMAWDAFHHLFDLTYVGFDSFEGLPEISKIDEQAIWEKGKLAYAEQKFIDTAIAHGIPKNRLVTIPGFYDKSLTASLAQELLPQKAAVIYVDCDLYTSTVSVLNWIPNFLQIGTVIVFDDWNCFCADPDRGERRAWREFLEVRPNLKFEPFVSTAEGQAFIFVGSTAS